MLKLNAFDGRQQPKDAYDVLLATTQFVGGADAAVAAFQAERKAGNRGFARAAKTLQRHFFSIDQSGPIRGAEFALEGGDAADATDRRRQIQERMVTVGLALAGGK